MRSLQILYTKTAPTALRIFDPFGKPTFATVVWVRFQQFSAIRAKSQKLGIEHGLPVTFATMRLSGLVHNVDARGAIAFIEAEDAVGLVCWLLGPELLKKMSAGFREIGDDKNALDERQRAEALATIDADSLAAERAECSLVWAAAERGEIIDFRPTTSQQALLGVALQTLPRAINGPSSPEHAYDIVQPGGGRR
jgi:hypothetical protein